jgi:hypothetical protein
VYGAFGAAGYPPHHGHEQLAAEQAAAFRKVVTERFAAACDAYAKDRATPWPASLRIKSVRGAPGVLEMTVVRQPGRSRHL